MAKKFSELRSRMRPEAQAQAQAKTQSLQTSLKLQELRKSLHVTQTALAQSLCVQQAAISRMESRDDLLVSSVMEFVRGLGGQLVLTATFPGNRTFDLTPETGSAHEHACLPLESAAPVQAGARVSASLTKRIPSKRSA